MKEDEFQSIKKFLDEMNWESKAEVHTHVGGDKLTVVVSETYSSRACHYMIRDLEDYGFQLLQGPEPVMYTEDVPAIKMIARATDETVKLYERLL